MRVLSRHTLASWLRTAGIHRETMAWAEDAPVHRLLIREASLPEADSGPHRRIPLPGEDQVLRIAVGDRPLLGALVVQAVRETGAQEVAAATPAGTYWLNNRGYAHYLRKVSDAQRVHTFLRHVGLTDRFQGGFLIREFEYETHLPLLACQPFCGGPDVYFVCRARPLVLMACHELDLHVETPDAMLAARIRQTAQDCDLTVRGSDVAAVPP